MQEVKRPKKPLIYFYVAMILAILVMGFRPSGSSRWKSLWPDFSLLPLLQPVYSYTIAPRIV